MIAAYSGFPGIARPMLLALMAAALLASETATAVAQSQNCTQIVSLLRGIERNRLFTGYQAAAGQLRTTELFVREQESVWIRGGCQQAHNAGQAMSRECRNLALAITSGRNDVERLTAQVREGQSLAQHREALLQDHARFRCGSPGQSGVSISTQANVPEPQRRSLLDQLFGANQQTGFDYIETPVDPWSHMATRRTVCVRTCDGFFWPMSFSTVDQYITQDAIRCHEMCPGTEVLLFSYRNPGEEPEDMISLSGVPYRSMPYAFRYRESFDMECSCRQTENLGTIALAGDLGQSRAVIDFGETAFPLPQRDPRRTAETVVAEALFVPLPRPRPRDDGTAPVAATTRPVDGDSDLNIVYFGDRPVRIVGPATPFVPPAEGAS